jgi:hypothetical protein
MTPFNKLIFTLSLTGFLGFPLPGGQTALGESTYYPDPNQASVNNNSYSKNGSVKSNSESSFNAPTSDAPGNNSTQTSANSADFPGADIPSYAAPPANPNSNPFIIEPDGIPALNIVAPPERPPLPAPARTLPGFNTVGAYPSGKAAIKVESWRPQALKLQKLAITKLDLLNTVSLEAQSNMESVSAALPAIANINSNGVFLYAHAATAGQALLLLYNADRNVTEKLYLVYMPNTTGKIELRAQCENKNKLLNQAKAQAILNLLKKTAEEKANPQNLL